MNLWLDFEGIDGSGKTTVSNRVADALRARGVEVVHAREGGKFASGISGRVRDLARSDENLRLAPETELLLNLAREAQLMAEIIRPALRRGAWVITDRTTFSHIGLARYVRGIAGPEVEAAARLASQGCRPDRVFLIDVDPDVARWRRRVRKVLDRRLSDSGRKGLLGDSLAWRTRQGFLEFAAAERWDVIDNTWRSADESVRAVLDILGGAPAPSGPERGPRIDPSDLLGSYFAFVDGLADRSLAALLAAGLDDPRADAIRRRAAADLAAYAVTGMDAPSAWALRRDLRGESPYYVARGLSGLGTDPRAWELRRELEAVVPDQVLHGLSGEGTPEAHEVRARRFDEHSEEAVRSTKGLDDPPSWDLRLRLRGGRPSAALAESLSGLNDPRAAELRSELRPAIPLAVLRGAKGVDHPDAWALRQELAAWAPKAVLASIEGMDGPEASALRKALRPVAPEETAASLAGIGTEESWKTRWDSVDEAPVGTLKSVRKVDRERAEPLVARIVERHGSRLRVAREAVQFSLRTPWTISSD
jgi:dTMP kinase